MQTPFSSFWPAAQRAALTCAAATLALAGLDAVGAFVVADEETAP
jgi:hypothetical protein